MLLLNRVFFLFFFLVSSSRDDRVPPKALGRVPDQVLSPAQDQGGEAEVDAKQREHDAEDAWERG